MKEAATVPHTRKDFLSVLDFEPADLERCLDLAAQVKADRSLGSSRADGERPRRTARARRCSRRRPFAPGRRSKSRFTKSAVMWCRFSPTRRWASREPVEDVARNIERWVDAVVIRTFSQRLLEEFAAAAPKLHVINALSDTEHPCQALSRFPHPARTLGHAAGPDDRLHW